MHPLISAGKQNLEDGRLDEALQIINEAALQIPNDPDVHSLRGSIRAAMGDIEQAVGDFDRSLHLNSKQVEVFRWRGGSHMQLGDYASAVVDFGKVTRLDPLDFWSFLSRAEGLLELEEFDQAEEDLDDAFRLLDMDLENLKPDLVALVSKLPVITPPLEEPEVNDSEEEARGAALRVRGRLYLKRRQFAEAIADFRASRLINSADGWTANHLAWLLATCPMDELRNGAEAIVLATEACELMNDNTEFFAGTLAAAYAETGQFDKAVEWQQIAFESYSDSVSREWGFLLELYKSGMPYRLGRKTLADLSAEPGPLQFPPTAG